MTTEKWPAPNVAQGWPENYGAIEHKLGSVPLPTARSQNIAPVNPTGIKPNMKPKE